MILRRQIVWENAASREFDRLPSAVQDQIDEALAQLVLTGRGNLQHLKGIYGDEWRLRVGDYRVRFALKDDNLLVLHVRQRGSAYRD